MVRRLLLFDIDGTLLRMHGPAGRAITATLQDLLGHFEPPSFRLSFSGKTDRRILREFMQLSGYEVPDFEALFADFLSLYPAHFERALEHEQHTPLPGVFALLDELIRREDALLGLVTGNVEATAWMKLRATGLADYFGFGAFGCEHEERPELVRLAIQRGSARARREVAGPEVVVIGDSVHDVTSTHPFAATSVAVCTGPTPKAELAALSPHYLWEDLRDTAAVVAALLDDYH